MKYNAKTDWVDFDIANPDNPDNIVKASDFNRVEQGIKDASIELNTIENTLTSHITDNSSHVTQVEKNQWNNISNPNLLINSDFKIWQRGNRITSVAGKWTYTADRFRAKGSGTVEKRENGIYISSANGGITLEYILEDKDFDCLVGKMVTVSYRKNDIEYILYSTSLAGKVIFAIDLARGDTLNWVKAELGRNKTPYIPISYGEELLKCQRYYQKHIAMAEQSIKSVSSGSTFVVSFSIQKMRIVPKVTAPNLSIYIAYGVSPIIYNGAPYSSDSYVNVWFSSTNFPNASDGYLTNKTTDGSGGIFLDAEIY